MNHRAILVVGLIVGGVALLAISSPFVAGTFGSAASEHSSDTANNSSTTMTETQFPWGAVLYETDSETGETHITVNVKAEGDISVSTVASDEPRTVADADSHDETKEFPWGTVAYTNDSDSEELQITVIIDAEEEEVSLSVSTSSENETHHSTSQSTTVVQSTSNGESTTSVTQSTESSQSTTSSVRTSSTTEEE